MRTRWVFEKPAAVYGALVPLLVVFWFLSGMARGLTPTTGGWQYRVGATSWALFGLVLLLTVLYTIALLVRRVAFRRSTAN